MSYNHIIPVVQSVPNFYHRNNFTSSVRNGMQGANTFMRATLFRHYSILPTQFTFINSN